MNCKILDSVHHILLAETANAKKNLQRWIRIVPYGKNGAVRKYFVTAQVCKNRVARRGLTQSFKPQEKLKYLKGDKM